MTRRRRGAAAGLEPRMIRRESDGTLYDLDEHRRLTVSELRQEVREGRRFRVQRHDTGVDCTYEVLAELVGSPGGARTGSEPSVMSTLAQALVSSLLAQADGNDLRREARRRLGDRARHDPPGPDAN